MTDARHTNRSSHRSAPPGPGPARGIPPSYLRRLALLSANATPDGLPPFAGFRVVTVLHGYQNLLGVLVAMERCGLDPAKTVVFIKAYQYARRGTVIRELKRAGYTVYGLDQLHSLPVNAIVGGGTDPVLVVEDGGHATERLLSDELAAARVAGVVEQTTKGVWRIKAALNGKVPAFPIITIPDSQLKQRVEPPHIGEAAVHAVVSILGHVALRNRKVAVLGAGGSIGSAVLDSLEEMCVKTRYYDADPTRLAALLAGSCGTLARSAAEALKGASVVFGATGAPLDKDGKARPSIGLDEIPFLSDGVWLASVSSDQVEFDLDALRAVSDGLPRPIRLSELHERDDDRVVAHEYIVKGKRIRVLLEGMPVNFGEFGSMPDEVADLIMTLVFLSAVDVVRQRFSGARGMLPEATNKVAERHRLAEQWIDLTVEQRGGGR